MFADLLPILYRQKAYIDPGVFPPRVVLPFATGEHAEAIQTEIKAHWPAVLDFFGMAGEGDVIPDDQSYECPFCRGLICGVIDRQAINLACSRNECPFFRGGEERLDRADCRSCGKPVMWATTDSGKRIPLDVRPTEGGNLIVSPFGIARPAVSWPRRATRYNSHFATCAHAKKWRKGKQP